MKKEKSIQTGNKQRTLWQETWRRFKKNKLAVAGMIFLLILIVIAIGTVIVDIVTQNAIYDNYVVKQNLRGRLQPPSSKIFSVHGCSGNCLLLYSGRSDWGCGRILWRKNR